MSGDIGLGRLIEEPRGRDAVHVAVIPVIAGEDLLPGDKVKVGDLMHVFLDEENPDGIVDPFLRERVPQGSSFYLCMFPGSIVSLRHEWTHPVFDSKPPEDLEKLKEINEAKIRIQEILHKLMDWNEDASYDELEGLYKHYIEEVESENGFTFNMTNYYDSEEELKHLTEIVLGRKLDENFYFSCSC